MLFLHIVAPQFCILTNGAQESNFDNSHPTEHEVIVLVVLICISLMNSNGEHLFMYLLAILLYSWTNVY